jgi:hypothetical protein
MRHEFAPTFVNYKNGALDSQPQVIPAYQLLAHGRWFSPGTPTSSTTKTGCNDIAEILLKVALNTINIIKSNRLRIECTIFVIYKGGRELMPHGLLGNPTT